ncbi:MAG: transporter substrate-binding domain-containing protein [Bacteriovoracaceae bacterium]|nr:transporter substrate-binding domain-containing protein [Bacteriovoracaceae bacterium]
MKNFINLMLLVSCTFGISAVEAKNLTVGVESLEYLPFYSGKGRGGYNGFARELMDKFASDHNHEVTYIPVQVKKLFGKYINKTFDFKFPDNALWRADERKGKGITYSDVVVKTKVGVISLSSKKDVVPAKVGVVDGFTPWPILDDVKAGKIKLVQKTRMIQLLKLVESGEVDGVYGSMDALKFHAAKIGDADKFMFNSNVKASMDEFYLSTNSDSAVIDEFKKWSTKNASYISDLKKKYGISEK